MRQSALVLLALAASVSLAATDTSAPTDSRQGRSISSSSSGNNLVSSTHNTIEHSTGKSRLESEKRQVQEFLSAKNIFKSIVKLVFGNADEANATSRQVMTMISKFLDMLKHTFGAKQRSGTARTIRDSAEDAASASVSMLQGYVKSMLAPNANCQKRYLCQASREATRDAKDVGYLIASVGGYATSYLLDSSRSGDFQQFHEATSRGRSLKPDHDCVKLYECNETL